MSDDPSSARFVPCEDIPWGHWSVSPPAITDDGCRELLSVALAECHQRDNTIAALTKHIEALQDEIQRYTRHAVQSSRLYARRLSAAADDDPLAASRGLGLDV